MGSDNLVALFLITFSLLNAVVVSEAKLDPAAFEKMALIANDYNGDPVNKYEYYYYDTLDFDEKVKVHFRELDPSESKCELATDDLNKDQALQVFCWQVPEKCTQICDDLGGLSFELNTLNSFSFTKYRIQKSMQFKFKNLRSIETDAFNGLVIGRNVKLSILIEGPDSSDLNISPNSFRSMTLEEHAEISISISGYKHVNFERESLLNIQCLDHSLISITVKESKLLIFRSGSMQLWKPFNNNGHIMLHLNASRVRELVFEKHSFSDIVQSHGSQLQIEASGFEKCSLGTESFSRMKQATMSSFLFNLNGKQLVLSDRLFMGTRQADL